MSLNELRTKLRIYSCNVKKNTECNKKHCVCNNGECRYTTKYKYAKNNLLNLFKRIFNLIFK